MFVKLAETISPKYHILLFPLNVIITIIVILIAYSKICSKLIIVSPQARGLPYSWLKTPFLIRDLRYYKPKQDTNFKP